MKAKEMTKATATTDETEADLTKQEQKSVDFLADGFETMSPKLRVVAFETLLATYCHECGEEQPEDPEEECPCIEASEVSEDLDEEEDDEVEDGEEDDEDDEGGDEITN